MLILFKNKKNNLNIKKKFFSHGKLALFEVNIELNYSRRHFIVTKEKKSIKIKQLLPTIHYDE